VLDEMAEYKARIEELTRLVSELTETNEKLEVRVVEADSRTAVLEADNEKLKIEVCGLCLFWL